MPESSTLENPLAEGLMAERQPDPCAIVIFGASGDLTERKLIPALFNLSASGYLPQRYAILGVGRTPMTDEEFRAKMAEGEGDASRYRAHTKEAWDDFASRLFYQG